MECWKWKEQVVAAIENKVGCKGIPLVCVICKQKPVHWTLAQAISKIKRLICQAALAEDTNDRDNSTAWVCLQKSTIEQTVYAWIHVVDAATDGMGR